MLPLAQFGGAAPGASTPMRPCIPVITSNTEMPAR